jgi:hypothetical protein
MTGAIAGVMAMATLVSTPQDTERLITGPPSLREHSVRAVALPPRPHRSSVRRPAAAHRITNPVRRPSLVARRLVVVQTRHVHAARRQLATTKPKPAPIAAPPPAPAVAPPADPAPVAEQESGPDRDHGNGHAYGHDKEHGNGDGGHED